MLAWRERRRCARISRHAAGAVVWGGGHVEGCGRHRLGVAAQVAVIFIEMSLGVVVGGDG